MFGYIFNVNIILKDGNYKNYLNMMVEKNSFINTIELLNNFIINNKNDNNIGLVLKITDTNFFYNINTFGDVTNCESIILKEDDIIIEKIDNDSCALILSDRLLDKTKDSILMKIEVGLNELKKLSYIQKYNRTIKGLRIYYYDNDFKRFINSLRFNLIPNLKIKE
jgi:hypothetical protein